MPRVRPCQYPGCTDYASGRYSYCPSHSTAYKAKRNAQRHQRADQSHYDDVAYRGKNGTRVQALKRDSYMCTWCGIDERLSVDHILPLSKGGSNHIENLRTLCESCHELRHKQDG